MKTIYEIATTNILVNGEKLKAFPVWYRQNIRQICQWKIKESPQIDLHKYLWQGAKATQRGEDHLFNKWCWDNRTCMRVCPESIQPHTMTIRGIYWRSYKIQETLYTGQWCLSPLQNRHLGTSHNSSNRHQLPHCIFLNLINGLKSLHFQRWF